MATVAALLAKEFAKLGARVKVVTSTPCPIEDSFPYVVIRRPSCGRLLQTYRWADAVLLQGLTLRLGWPLFLCRRPCLITHHMILNGGRYPGMIRRALLKLSRNISVSRAVAESLPVQSEVIHNPYDSETFGNGAKLQEGTGDLVFVGRLCADKGAGVLLSALSLLAGKRLRPSLTVVGEGEERSRLENEVRRHGLNGQVRFTGAVSGSPLADLLRRHRIMVVPSLCKEAFGIVALEGIACGCVVVGSDGGGLPEAIGPCGATFPNGDARALAEVIERLLAEPALMEKYRKSAQSHLAKHRPATVANRYLELLRVEASTAGGSSDL